MDNVNKSLRPVTRPRSKTGKETKYGRPMWKDEATGDLFSEKTVTVPYGDGFVVMPSVSEDGSELTEEQIFYYVRRNGPVDFMTGEKLPIFESMEEADTYAQKRSETMFTDEDPTEDNPYGFAEGGQAMSLEKQMRLFEEGGIADDGMSVDPVSGNEIPPGSLAEEVRDDVPAQLSEGEYVVPADVLRYYGVRFFEDLRAEAKQGLSQMDADGRIGGEPVPVGGPQMEEGDLTPEEMAVLQEMGMNVGGFVPQQSPPEAVGNTTMQMDTTAGYAEQMDTTAGYAEGGLETDTSRAGITTPGFTEESLRKDYGLGFSIFGPSSSTSTESSIETLYSPDGQVRSFRLPDEQEEYDRLISEGWTTAQTEVTTETSVGVADKQDVREGGGPDGGPDGGPNGGDDTTTQGPSISEMSDAQLASSAKAIGIMGTVGQVALGPVVGTALGTSAAARYNDLLDEMTARGLDTTGMSRKGSIFGGEESLLGGLNDVNNDGTVNFGDTFVGDLLGFDGKFGVEKGRPGLKGSIYGGRRGSTTTSTPNVSAATVAADAAAQSGSRGGQRGGNEGGQRGGNEGGGGGNAVGVDGPAPGASVGGNAPGVSASPSSGGASAGAASSDAAGSGHEGNADPAAGGSMLKKGGLVQRPTKKKKNKK